MSDAVTTPALALPDGNRKLKKGLLIGGGVFATLLAVLLIVPHFVDLGLFKRTYLPLIEDALGRRVDVGEVHLSLVPTPSIQISKLRVSDSQSFADNTFFAAQQVQLKLRLLPLLRGRFEVTELVLDKPVFNLLKQADGSFNYSDIATKKAPSTPRREARKKPEGGSKSVEAIPLALPSRMRVHDGHLNLATKGQTPVNIKGIDLALQEMSSDAPFPFRASFQYPGLNTVALEGQLDYQEEKALARTQKQPLEDPRSDVSGPRQRQQPDDNTEGKSGFEPRRRRRQADLPDPVGLRLRARRHGNLRSHGAEHDGCRSIERAGHRDARRFQKRLR